MPEIKTLDCTLRDGGYVNNWDFGHENIRRIIENLVNAGIDYIECGFLKLVEYDENRSVFPEISNLEKLLPQSRTKFTLMINYGDVKIEDIPEYTNKNILLRVALKKDVRFEAVEFCRQLKEKGYGVFVNPMHTNTYNSEEILEMVKEVNKFKPEAFTIVDTTGAMKENDILRLFYLIDSNLDKDVALCFHSHNNLQLSFSNAQCLLKICHDRKLIIDSTVFGMGRGAGNLCTELLTQYINDNYGGTYDILPVLKIIDEQINPIFALTPWGYSVPYYLAATNSCHPNYAAYLVNKQTVSVDTINTILKSIPEDKKAAYDKDLINQMYLAYQEYNIDDSKIRAKLKEYLKDKTILVLAPGKSLVKEKETIDKFISENNPFVISLNSIPENYRIDMPFITNSKRYKSLGEISMPHIITSNIRSENPAAYSLNYSSYLNKSNMIDNVALMFFTFLISIGVKDVYAAGLDGFSSVNSDNYFDNRLINNSKLGEIDERNKIMSEELNKLNTKVNLHFITPTLYSINEYIKA